MNFATVVAVFTPKSAGFAPITFKADVFSNEEEFLGEPQPDKERARLFMSNDGVAGQYVDIFSLAGKRDLSIFDGPQADKLTQWALTNPQPLFDFAFTYQRNDQDASQVRTHQHTDCKFMNTPGRAMSNDIIIVKFTFKYVKLAILDATGNLVS